MQCNILNVYCVKERAITIALGIIKYNRKTQQQHDIDYYNVSLKAQDSHSRHSMEPGTTYRRCTVEIHM